MSFAEAEFLEFGLDQGAIPGCIDEFEVISEFRIEADGEDVIVERDGMSFEKVTAREWAGAADGVEDACPEIAEVGRGSRSGCGCRFG